MELYKKIHAFEARISPEESMGEGNDVALPFVPGPILDKDISSFSEALCVLSHRS
jgi:hypothetical protein